MADSVGFLLSTGLWLHSAIVDSKDRTAFHLCVFDPSAALCREYVSDKMRQATRGQHSTAKWGHFLSMCTHGLMRYSAAQLPEATWRAFMTVHSLNSMSDEDMASRGFRHCHMAV